jgi:hypothetical protein
MQAERTIASSRDADTAAQLDALHAEVASLRAARVAEASELLAARARCVSILLVLGQISAGLSLPADANTIRSVRVSATLSSSC